MGNRNFYRLFAPVVRTKKVLKFDNKGMHFAKGWSYLKKFVLPTKISCLVKMVNMKKAPFF